jgi:hypothetical protein
MNSSELSRHTNQKKEGPTHDKSINPVMGIKEWGLIVVLSIIWGGSFFLLKLR